MVRISLRSTLSAGQCDMDLKAKAIGQGRVQGLQHSTYTGGRLLLSATTTERVSGVLLPPFFYMTACKL